MTQPSSTNELVETSIPIKKETLVGLGLCQLPEKNECDQLIEFDNFDIEVFGDWSK